MRRPAAVAALLAVLAVAQGAAVVSRRAGGGFEALRPGRDRVVSADLLGRGRVVRASVERDAYRPPTHALYGDPGLDDPLAGRTLAVGSGFHDNWPVVPRANVPEFRSMDLAGRKVAVGRDRVWTWVTWELPDCTDECQGYVAGRNLSEDDVVRAARGASVDRASPAIAPEALPAGLTLIVSGGVDIDGSRRPAPRT